MKYIQMAMIVVMLLMMIFIVICNKKITFEKRLYMVMVVIMGIICSEIDFGLTTKILEIVSIITSMIICLTEQVLPKYLKILYCLICFLGITDIVIS